MSGSDLGSTGHDRAAGVLVGAAAGDAPGAHYESGPRVAAEAAEMRPGALTGRPAGSYGQNPPTWRSAWLRPQLRGWPSTPPRDSKGRRGVPPLVRRRTPDIGNQAGAVLPTATDPSDLAKAAAKYQGTHPDAAGNGSLMRTGPVALAHLGDDKGIARAARAVSSLTHPPRPCRGCLRAVVRGHRPGGPRGAAGRHLGGPRARSPRTEGLLG
jgi:hypothetical protein